MKRALVLVLLVAAAAPAAAQPAAALGKPLMAPDLPPGTVTVRVIAGDPSAVVAGFDVTLRVNGAPRIARTDAEGRAIFGGLPTGATVQASVAGDGGEVSSEAFALPAAGGARVMISTRPAAAPQAPIGAPAGMPQPRQITGIPREESADPAGMLTVLVTHADITSADPPASHPVVLVGYTVDDRVVVLRDDTDASGRAEFTKLDISGDTAYYAMTLLPRAGGVDRLISPAFQPPIGLGLRMVLSGESRTSSAQPVDDLARLETQLPNVAPGVVAVAVLARQPDDGATADLVDAATGKLLATERLPGTAGAGLNTNHKFGDFEPDPTTPPGTLRVFAVSADGRQLAEASVALVPAEAGVAAPAPQLTDANGRATFTGVAAGQWRVVLDAGPARAESPPIVVPADHGGRIVGVLTWFDGIPPRYVQLRAGPASGDPVYVRLRVKGGVRKSLPFQVKADRGTTAPFELADQLLFAVVADGSVDDRYLGFHGRFTIANTWSTPFRASADGLVIRLPRGFVGGVVGEDDQKLVAPEAYEGFRIRRPIKPGQTSFVGGFSLPIDGGAVDWHLDLPWGAVQSRIAILDSPGMQVHLPGGEIGSCAVDPTTGAAPRACKTAPSGLQFYLIDNIEIPAGRSMIMRVTGLPMMPAWKIWLPRLAGVVVLGLLGLTITVVLRARRDGPREGTAARIQTLLDELVELEAKGQGGKRKDAALAELERLWEADGRTGRAG